MLTGEAYLKLLTLPQDLAAENIGTNRLCIGSVADYKVAPTLGGNFSDNGQRLIAVIGGGDNGAVLFSDTSLFKGDLGFCVAQNSRVIKGDTCNDRGLGVGYCVGGIKPTAKTDL